jgi:MoxR-like ATPase
LALSGRGNNWAQITLHADYCVQELMGSFQPRGVEFVWSNGPIIEQMLTGGLLVLNEIDLASEPVKNFLLAVLDDPEVAGITLPSGVRIQPHANLRVIATSNSPASVLDPALRSRFEAELELKTPHPDLILRLDQQLRGLGAAVADSFLDDASRALDPRKALSFAKLIYSGFAPREAALAAFGNRGDDVFAALASRGVVQ